MGSQTRWPVAMVLASVLVLVGVAAVAFAAGMASRGNPAPAVQTAAPVNPGLGPGFYGPFGRRGQVVPTVSGTVTAVAANSVTISQPNGQTRTLTLTGSTTYSLAGASTSQSALVVGVRIVARGSVDSSGNFTAAAVAIQPSVVQGVVASKTATTITVTTAAGKSVTVNVTSSTRYSVRGVASANLDSVAVGYRIAVQGTLNPDGSLNATIVQAAPNTQPGFGGRGGRGIPAWPGFGGGVSPNPSPSAAPSAI
jgi:hypothetical protein